ncbi:MAG: pitrilysin family protein [Acidobacteriota bacterium]
MSPKRIFLLMIGFVFALGAAAKQPNPLPKVPYELYRLSNGWTVILADDHSVPIVAVNVNYQVGSKNETPGKTGFAHLFEHMMFQGSKNYNNDYFKPLREAGAFVNGGTNTDRTRYLETVPSAYLERALWLEADRMGFLLDALTQKRLSNQISVVQNERRQRYENAPYGLVREKMMAVLYPPNHPYHWTTIGSMADLQGASMDDVRQFFKTYYAPNNASLCIVGDFDPAAAKKMVEKYFGAIPPGPPVSRLGEWVPSLPGEVTIEMQDRVQLPRTYVAWHTPPWYAADDAALDVFGRILGGAKTSRLYKELVYKRQIAQQAAAFNDASQIAGLFEIIVTPRPGQDAKKVEQAAFDVLNRTLKEGVTQDELDRAVTAITAQYVRSMQSVGGFFSLSDRMNSYYHYRGKPDSFRWDLQRYLDLTVDQVNAAARRYINGNRLIARVTPAGETAPGSSAAATGFDRSVMPGKGTQAAFALPERERFTLTNGLKVILVRDGDSGRVFRGSGRPGRAGRPDRRYSHRRCSRHDFAADRREAGDPGRASASPGGPRRHHRRAVLFEDPFGLLARALRRRAAPPGLSGGGNVPPQEEHPRFAAAAERPAEGPGAGGSGQGSLRRPPLRSPQRRDGGGREGRGVERREEFLEPVGRALQRHTGGRG